MAAYRTFIVGTHDEVAHHALPYADRVRAEIVDAEELPAVADEGDLAVFYTEHFDRFRDCWYQLKEKGVLTLYAIDGILEWRNAWENDSSEPACPWTMRPVLADKVACIGPSQARVLDAWGNVGKTEVIGVPRFDSIQKVERPKDECFRVLVMTAKWPGFTSKQIEQVKASLSDLQSVLGNIQLEDGRKVEISWRLTKNLDQDLGVSNQLNDVTGHDLADALRQTDAVITTPSTTMLESMLCGLPTCILDYTNSPRYVDAAWSITARQQMAETIQQLAAPNEPKRLHQEVILSDALANQGCAAEAMAELIEQMIRCGHDCRQAGNPVSFPSELVQRSEPPSEKTFHCFPAMDEMADADRQELLALVAEMRRTISVLQDRNEVLEQTLNEACEALQGVHQNPLAGPVIRLGDRLKSLKERFRQRSNGTAHSEKNESHRPAPK